jgi:hypothetical protein
MWERALDAINFHASVRYLARQADKKEVQHTPGDAGCVAHVR